MLSKLFKYKKDSKSTTSKAFDRLKSYFSTGKALKDLKQTKPLAVLGIIFEPLYPKSVLKNMVREGEIMARPTGPPRKQSERRLVLHDDGVQFQCR